MLIISIDTFTIHSKITLSHQDPILHTILLTNGHLMTSSYDDSIIEWDLNNGKAVKEIKLQNAPNCFLEFLDSHLIYSSFENNFFLLKLT